MDKINAFTDLKAWKKAHNFAVVIYKITEKFPAREQFSLSAQMRRAAVSTPSNTELQAQILIARDVGYVTEQAAITLIEKGTEVHKIVTGLIKSTKLRGS